MVDLTSFSPGMCGGLAADLAVETPRESERRPCFFRVDLELAFATAFGLVIRFGSLLALGTGNWVVCVVSLVWVVGLRAARIG